MHMLRTETDLFCFNMLKFIFCWFSWGKRSDFFLSSSMSFFNSHLHTALTHSVAVTCTPTRAEGWHNQVFISLTCVSEVPLCSCNFTEPVGPLKKRCVFMKERRSLWKATLDTVPPQNEIKKKNGWVSNSKNSKHPVMLTGLWTGCTLLFWLCSNPKLSPS